MYWIRVMQSKLEVNQQVWSALCALFHQRLELGNPIHRLLCSQWVWYSFSSLLNVTTFLFYRGQCDSCNFPQLKKRNWRVQTWQVLHYSNRNWNKNRVQRKHLRHFIKSMRGHIHVLKWNINTKYIYMYKLWQRQIEAYQVLSKNVNSQKNMKRQY